MQKLNTILAMSILLIFSLALVSAGPTQGSGSIWTTNADCGNRTQNVNQYFPGDAVYINGNNFESDNYIWSISQVSGGPDKQVVANGTYSASGSFCFQAYIVSMDDYGEYSVDFGKKNDNYHVMPAPIVPEFSTTIGILTIFAAIATLFIIRRN